MKTKLTITVDVDVLPRAKRYARAQGVSLSSIINDVLHDVAGQEAPSFVDRWRGAFKAADLDDARYEALAAKYL